METTQAPHVVYSACQRGVGISAAVLKTTSMIAQMNVLQGNYFVFWQTSAELNPL